MEPLANRLTNRQQAQSDLLFRRVCELSGVFPSRNNYRKWKYQRGRAWEYFIAHRMLCVSTSLDNKAPNPISA